MIAVDPTFKDALQASFFNFSNGLKTAMFEVVGQALGKLVGYGHVPLASEADMMQSLVQTKSAADTVVQRVLSNSGFIIPIAKTVGKLVERADDKHQIRKIDRASKINASTNPFIERAQSGLTRPSKVLSNS